MYRNLLEHQLAGKYNLFPFLEQIRIDNEWNNNFVSKSACIQI